MIALTDGLRKGSFAAYCAPDPGELSHSRRHGIVSGIIIRPFFRQPPAALDCEKKILRWPGSFGFGFLSPQPPGIVGTGPSAANKRANVSWPFLFERMSFERVAYAERRRRKSTTAPLRMPRSESVPTIFSEISAAPCRPRPAWVRACRDCRPGSGLRRRRRRLAPRCRAAQSSSRACRSSRRPSRDYEPHCSR